MLGLMLPGCQRSPVRYPTVEGPLAAGEGLRIGMVSSSRRFYDRRAIDSSIDAAYLLRDHVNQCGGVNRAPVSLALEYSDPLTRNKVAAVRDLLETHRVHGAIASLKDIESTRSLELMVESRVPVLLFNYYSTTAAAMSSLQQKLDSPQGYWGQLSPSYDDTIEALAQVIWSQGYTQVAIVRTDKPSDAQWAESLTRRFELLGGQRIEADSPIVMPHDDGVERWGREWEDYAESLLETDETGESDGDRPDEGFRFEPTQEERLAAWLEQDQTAVVVVLNRFASLSFLQAIAPLAAAEESMPIFWANWLEFRASFDLLAPKLNASKETGDRPTFTGIAGILPATVGDGFLDFKQAWTHRFEDEPPAGAAYAWDALAMFALAAEAAGSNGGSSLATHLRAIATPPGVAVTDVCEGLERLRAGEPIDFEGASGSLNLNSQGEVESQFNLWRITQDGQPGVIDRVSD